MFDYDWFHGACFKQQSEEAKSRCAATHFAAGNVDPAGDEAKTFNAALETRTLIYLRDGFSYEIREIAELDSKSHLVFECEPVDDQYKVGAFVVTVPFDEIVRVEVYAVHPSEKPADSPQITGFRGSPEPSDQKFDASKSMPGGRGG